MYMQNSDPNTYVSAVFPYRKAPFFKGYKFRGFFNFFGISEKKICDTATLAPYATKIIYFEYTHILYTQRQRMAVV